MSSQAGYSRDDWDLIIGAPTLAALAVMRVGEHSPRVAHRQLLAVGECLHEASEQDATGGLILAVAAAAREGQASFWPAELPHNLVASQPWALERCQQVVALLAQKAPEEEADAYACWLLTIGQRVTLVEDDQASQSQDGARVAERQQADLEALAAALGVQAPSGARCGLQA